MQGGQGVMLICADTFRHVTVGVTERKTQWDQEGPEERADCRKCPVLLEGEQTRLVVHMLLLHRWARLSLPTAVVILALKGLRRCDSCPSKGEVLPPV